MELTSFASCKDSPVHQYLLKEECEAFQLTECFSLEVIVSEGSMALKGLS